MKRNSSRIHFGPDSQILLAFAIRQRASRQTRCDKSLA